MRYFSTLPELLVTYENGTTQIITDLLVRANVINKNFNNPLSFYTYDIKDDDTPEIIAEKYYDDPYRYWIVLLVNERFDPLFDWPMKSSVFERYIQDKYTPEEAAAIHHYERIVTQRELSSDTLTINKYMISEDEYNSEPDSEQIYTLPSGQVYVITTNKAVSVYEDEWQKNEDKRNIKLLRTEYVQQFEEEFVKLMS